MIVKYEHTENKIKFAYRPAQAILLSNNIFLKMVLTYQKFDFENKCLIEKVIIQAPFRFSYSFHEEACFIYFAEGKTQINSPTEQESIQPEESVLLKCGNYLADLVKYPADRQNYEEE